jgi:hypothetical protein
MSNKQDFAAWMEQRKAPKPNASDEEDDDWSASLLGWQKDAAAHLHSYSSLLPDSSTGPLSAEYRDRLTSAIYLLLLALLFGTLAVIIGLPTLLIKPSKFVLCSTLCSLCVAGSMVLLKGPTLYLQELLAQLTACSAENPPSSSAVSLLLVVITNGATIAVTVLYHSYLLTLVAAGLQALSLLFYLLSYIPGGSASAGVLLRSAWFLVGRPCIYSARAGLQFALGCLWRSVAGSE